MNIPINVLIIEDSDDDKELILRELNRGGYAPDFLCIQTKEALNDALDSKSWDLILSDYVMPNFDGLSALKIVKNRNIDIPFIIISGTIGESVAVNAMRCGAHDYLMKDNLARLIPAIKRELEDFKIRKQRKQAISDLHQSELKYKQLFENDLTGDCITDIYGNILLCNKAMARIFGFNSVDDLIKINIAELYQNKNDREILLKLVAENKIVENYELEYIRIDGKIITVIENVIGSFNERGELETLTGYMFDITHRKNAEKALKESEKKFRSVWEKSTDGMRITNEKGTVILVNEAFCKLIGKPHNEIEGKPMSCIYEESRHEDILAKHQMRFSSRTIPEYIEREITIWNGKKLFLELSNSFLEIENQPTLSLSVFRNITERKKAEEQLQKLNLAINNSKDVIFMTDKKGIITYINSEFTNMYGYSSEEIVGNVTPRILKSGITSYDKYQQLWSTLLLKNNFTFELVNKCKNGNLIDIKSSTDVILDNYGEIIGFLAIQSDITDRKKSEMELILAKEKAEESEKLKSEFLAQISHEIRTPLNIIINNSSFLKYELNGSLEEELKYCFDSVDIASQRIIRTVDLILNMSEIQTGSFNLYKREIDIVPNIIIPLIKEHSILAKNKNISLNFESKTNNKLLLCDEYCITQIIANLIDNAIKYTSKGKVLVSLYDGEQSKLTLEVIDTGQGMSENFLKKLFEPFSQEEQGYSRKFDGTGLGLAIVKKYCELNNADIFVESKKNVGSKFKVVFN